MSRLGGVVALCVHVVGAVHEPSGFDLSGIDFLKSPPAKSKKHIDFLRSPTATEKSSKTDDLDWTGRGVNFESLDFLNPKSNKKPQASDKTAAFKWDANMMFDDSKQAKASKVKKVAKKRPVNSERDQNDGEEYHFKMVMEMCPLGDSFEQCLAAKNVVKNKKTGIFYQAKSATTNKSMNASLKTHVSKMGTAMMSNTSRKMSKANVSNVLRKTRVKQAKALVEEEVPIKNATKVNVSNAVRKTKVKKAKALVEEERTGVKNATKVNVSNVLRKTTVKKAKALVEEERPKSNMSNASTRSTKLKKAQAIAKKAQTLAEEDEAAEPSWGQLQGLKDMLGGIPNPVEAIQDAR